MDGSDSSPLSALDFFESDIKMSSLSKSASEWRGLNIVKLLCSNLINLMESITASMWCVNDKVIDIFLACTKCASSSSHFFVEIYIMSFNIIRNRFTLYKLKEFGYLSNFLRSEKNAVSRSRPKTI